MILFENLDYKIYLFISKLQFIGCTLYYKYVRALVCPRVTAHTHSPRHNNLNFTILSDERDLLVKMYIIIFLIIKSIYWKKIGIIFGRQLSAADLAESDRHSAESVKCLPRIPFGRQNRDFRRLPSLPQTLPDSGRSASEPTNLGRLCRQTFYLSEGSAAEFF